MSSPDEVRWPPRRVLLQWAAFVMLAVTALVFVANQAQQPSITFAEQVPRDIALEAESRPAPPSYQEILAEHGPDEKFIVVPGGYAVMDEPLVAEWMAKAGASRVIVLPALDPDATKAIDVPSDVVLVVGTEVSYDGYTTASTDIETVRALFGANDVTSSVVALLADAADEPDPDAVRDLVTREPTPEETSAMLADLQDDGIAFVAGAEPFERPTTNAFSTEPLYIVAPAPAPGEAAVDYSAAVEAAFPGRPLVTMTGLWMDFHGDEITEIEPALTASFYGAFEQRLREHAYSQEAVLQVGLNRVEQFRGSGMFGREMPYVAPDPLHVTAPVLPWVCAGLAVVLLAGSMRPRRDAMPPPHSLAPADARRFAGLSDLAVEISGLVTDEARPAFVRASRALAETRDATGQTTTTDADIAALLDRAERDLTEVADRIEREDYRPQQFLDRWRS